MWAAAWPPAALAVGFGYSGTAMADPYADSVEAFVDTGGNGSNPLDARFASDGNFAVLGDGGVLILRFTDNTCLNGNGDDLRIDDGGDATAEDYNVAVGFIGQVSLPSLVNVTEAVPTDIELGAVVS